MTDRTADPRERKLRKIFQRGDYSENLPDFISFMSKNQQRIRIGAPPFFRQARFPAFAFSGAALAALVITAALVLNAVLGGQGSLDVVFVSGETSSSGETAVYDKTGRCVAGYSKNGVRAGNLVVTPAGSTITLQLPGKINLTLGPSSEAEFLTVASGGRLDLRVVLKYGRISVHSGPLSKPESCEILASGLSYTIAGTVFSISAGPDGGSSLSVLEGGVRVRVNTGSSVYTGLAEKLGLTASGPSLSFAEIKSGQAADFGPSAVTNLALSVLRRLPVPDSLIKTRAPDAAESFELLRIEGLPLNGKISNAALPLQTNAGPAWKDTLDMADMEHDPLVCRGHVVFAVLNRLFIVDAFSGKSRTAVVTEEGSQLTAPLAVHDRVVLGSDRGGIYVYSLDGTLLWKDGRPGSQMYFSRPAFSGGTIAVPSMNNGVCLFSESGDFLGRIDASEAVFSTPLLINKGKTIIYGTENGLITARNVADKKELWAIQAGGGRLIYPLLGGDDVFAAVTIQDGLSVTGFDARTGAVIWNKKYPAPANDGLFPMLTASGLLLPTGGQAALLELESGGLVRMIRPEKSIRQLCADSGDIFILENDGTVLRTSDAGPRPVLVMNKSGLKHIASAGGAMFLFNGDTLTPYALNP